MEPGLPLRPHSAAPSLAPVPHYTDLGLEAGGLFLTVLRPFFFVVLFDVVV